MSGKAIAMESLKEKWVSIVQSAEEKGEKGIGGSSTVTQVSQRGLGQYNPYTKSYRTHGYP